MIRKLAVTQSNSAMSPVVIAATFPRTFSLSHSTDNHSPHTDKTKVHFGASDTVLGTPAPSELNKSASAAPRPD
jgi:hypothetical protein